MQQPAPPSRRRPFGSFLIWALALTFALPLPVVAAPVPEPAPGEWADATLALLRYNRDRCTSIADRVLSVWQRSGEAASTEGIQAYVLEHQVADLASARASGDMVRALREGTLGEVPDETGATIERLFEAQTALCDAVAHPTGSLGTFGGQVDGLLERIVLEERELGRLLVVPEEDLDRALAPYQMPIQLAGVEAESELIDYLESLKPKPRVPTMEERMQAWHRQYQAAAQPTKAALGRFQTARRKGEVAAVGSACRDLSREAVQLLQHEAVFKAPDGSSESALRKAYQNLKLLAGLCTQGDFRRVDAQMKNVQHSLGEAARLLSPYGLRP